MRPRRTCQKKSPAAWIAVALLYALGFAAGAHAAGTTLYKWVDQDGVTHYSDRPAPGAQRVQIGAPQSYKSPPTATRPQPPPTAAPRREVGAAAYTRVAIDSPAPGRVFLNEGSSIGVSAVVEPQLVPGHQLWFVLDSQRVQGKSTTDLAPVLEVGRGEHTIAVTIADEYGNELVTSATVAFVVRLPSVVNPPRGPLQPPLRPPSPVVRKP